jgi:NAD(P)-dependent dehydrogenase (short-subunit alcohol dehydrogenase family)
LPTGDRRVVLLTGAGGLLGDAFCRQYADQYDIVAVCRTRLPGVPSQYERFVDPLEPTAEVAENTAKVFTVFADLERTEDIDRVVEVTLARYDRIDVLVNNAAYMGHYQHGMLDGDVALEELERHLRINVTIPFRLAIRVAQQFWKDRAAENRALGRNVVNVSSIAGSRVYPHIGQAPYAASKAALNQLTRHMAAEFDSFGVRVNALAPNSFPSRVRTEAVSDAIARLDREPVTGKVLVMDGGD